MKYVDLVMKLLTDRMPRKVAVASVVLAGTLLLFVILLPTLGGADDQANDDNTSMKAEIQQTTKNLRQAKDDHQFVVDNQQKYEDLIHGDRLVPHTQRVAMAQMQKLAVQRGLSALSYNFTAADDHAAATAGSQPVSGGYKVKVTKIDLKVGSALDTQMFDFVADLGDSFPGAAIVQQVTLERAPDLTTEALNQVSRGQDSGLVKGQVVFNWRTAEAQDDSSKGAGKK